MMREQLSGEEFVELLQHEVALAGGQTAWGKLHGAASNAVNTAVRGTRSPSAQIVAALGYVSRTVYLRRGKR